MKKIFTTIFLPLIFCATILAEDFVVTTVKGNVKYETSEGVWEFLKPDETITGETFIDVKLNSQLEIKREDGKIYKIKSMQKGTVERLIAKYSVDKKDAINNKESAVSVRVDPVLDFKYVLSPEEEVQQANRMDNITSETLNGFDFSSIKKLPKGKNVVRLCSDGWLYEIIELTWTNSSASVVYLLGNIESGLEVRKRTERKVGKQDVKKILDLIQKTNFYNQSQYGETNGWDGDTWYVEANINGSYKSLSRQEPEETFLKDLGEALYDLTK